MSPYEDILSHSRPVSGRRAPMSLHDRAAQFSPFAALTGYDGIIAETGRLTQRFIELDEGAIAQLNKQLKRILSVIDEHPTVTVTWFRPDDRKEGGSYETKTGIVKKLDATEQYLEFTDRKCIPFCQLLSIHLHPD